ncbi:DNA polymerase III subunits gamma and tau [hydrothermal vent metagenome]|uniref:DNA-directed DNA polymerase n=1 Tax=hydrothermal vent metagenome TaxID=652676 RepID=A0A3B0RDS0_9ZZZZ
MTTSDSETNENTDPPDPDQNSMFGDAETGIVPSYQVLARKYRPRTFADLIGQEPMVHTLTNAFAASRIAHAFMLTGVRGVGKTTTARLLARALNFEDKTGPHPNMQLDPPGVHCAEISASRHMDVMEMDAASHTGIGDIREILDGVRYAPVSAKYKVYIIDEVHMLSKPAFNALLKTLEEPPPHAIFILATTEIRKVPVTILSRCQRFDLSRVGPEAMLAHLSRVCKLENRQVSEAGLQLIARASEGSVRDALSILDQALVQADDDQPVAAETLRVMLGLADRTRVLELFALTMRADAPAALAELREQYNLGADPVVIVTDLLDHCHQITRAKALAEAADLSGYGPGAEQIRQLAENLSMGQLSRVWQMLLKAAGEVRIAPEPLAALEMALIRLIVAASLPPPETAAKLLEQATNANPPTNSTPPTGGGNKAAKQHQTAATATQTLANPVIETSPKAASSPDTRPRSFAALLTEIEQLRELDVLYQLEQYVRLVHYQPGAITFVPTQDAPDNLATELARQLQDVTGDRWLFTIDRNTDGQDTIDQVRRKNQETDQKYVLADPSVIAIMQAFPKAEVVEILAAPDEEDEKND